MELQENNCATLELEMSQDMKELLQRAADLSGVDLSTFILDSANEKAMLLLEDNRNQPLSKESQLKLAEILKNSLV